MPTNGIAGDACRLNLQLLTHEKRLIGQAAMIKGYKSVGEYVRSLIQHGLDAEDPALGRQYREARKNRYTSNFSIPIFQPVFDTNDFERKPSPLQFAGPRKEQSQS